MAIDTRNAPYVFLGIIIGIFIQGSEIFLLDVTCRQLEEEAAGFTLSFGLDFELTDMF